MTLDVSRTWNSQQTSARVIYDKIDLYQKSTCDFAHECGWRNYNFRLAPMAHTAKVISPMLHVTCHIIHVTLYMWYAIYLLHAICVSYSLIASLNSHNGCCKSHIICALFILLLYDVQYLRSYQYQYRYVIVFTHCDLPVHWEIRLLTSWPDIWQSHYPE